MPSRNTSRIVSAGRGIEARGRILLAAILLGCAWLPLQSVAQQPPLDLTSFVVLGDGLAAGYADFSLHQVNQKASFPAVMAELMDVGVFPQPLLQAPGLGNVPGFPPLPPRVPATLQTTVRVAGGPKPTGRVNAQPPFSLFVFNVSIPGLKLADILARHPVRPLVHSRDMQQTLINMTIGFPEILVGQDIPLWTPLEYARRMNPSFAMISVGYYDFVDAVGKGDPELLPNVSEFRANFATVVSTLRSLGAPVLITTVPDPLDTAYVATLTAAGEQLAAPVSVLQGFYNLQDGDLVTIPGLVAMGSQLLAEEIGDLPAGSVISAGTANLVRQRVQAVNTAIREVAQQSGAVLYDLNAYFGVLRATGLTVGDKTLTANFQGGLYSLSGFYPGATMHAAIASQLVGAVNQAFGTNFPAADLTDVAEGDPSVRLIPARRLPESEGELE